MTPSSPRPASSRKLVGSATPCVDTPSARTIAPAKGCDERSSRAVKIVAKEVSFSAEHQRMAFTSGRPSVIVPVLSKTKVSTWPAASSASALRTKSPSSAPRPIPTMIAVGVASPRAQGQAMMSTVTAATKPCSQPSTGLRKPHATKVKTAIRTITGTKTRAIRSTTC